MKRKKLKLITIAVLLSCFVFAGGYIYRIELYNALYLLREEEPEQDSTLNITRLKRYIAEGCIYQEEKYVNPYFFRPGQREVVYQCYHCSLNGNNIEQNIKLHITKIRELDEGILYTLELDELDEPDPYDQMGSYRRYLGYFYVTEEEIWRVYRPGVSYTAEMTEDVVRRMEETGLEAFDERVIVCNEPGTDSAADENGWHEYVDVEGDKRIFRLYSAYIGRTTEYQRIVWEKGKGITYYINGAGSMKRHVELWQDIPEERLTIYIMKSISMRNPHILLRAHRWRHTYSWLDD
jgi:hypothetical protein